MVGGGGWYGMVGGGRRGGGGGGGEKGNLLGNKFVDLTVVHCRRLTIPELSMSGTGKMEKFGSVSPSDLVFVPRTSGSKSPELWMESEWGSGRKLRGAQGRHRATSGPASQVGGETAVPFDARSSAFTLIPEILSTPMTHARSTHVVSRGGHL